MEGATVLLADDDRAIRTVLTRALNRIGCRVRATGTVSSLWSMVDQGDGDIIVSDVHMPDGDALDLLPAIRRKRPDLPIIVMSAQNTVMTAIRAAEVGAYEYLPKPFDLKHLLSIVEKAFSERNQSEAAAVDPAERRDENLPLIGRSQAMQDVYRIMARLMNTDLTVMISGESGTGKELVARALHNFGQRSQGPFVAINMAAIPRELIESELFGHERGAFTGATEKMLGKFDQAKGGTLFLDEIGDMPAEAQTRLLRVLQEGEFTAVGGRTTRKADVRIVSATHRDLRALINEGKFREDLFYRLNVVPVRLPPLRERIDDIPDLARAFLRESEKQGLPHKTLTVEAIERLKEHSWPGNVRELENLVKRIAALRPDDPVPRSVVEEELNSQTMGIDEGTGTLGGDRNLASAVEHHIQRIFDIHGETLPPNGLYDRILREVELPLIAITLAATRGNQLKAADLLGINRNTLRKKIRELDIPVTRGKKLM
ncbi:nitrogen regulation protein NR(I) [Rhodobacteraceae bacterium NNCM2]|nr:nitrogen regulation protein NR(I) [Coraliihabitans acroporae]